MDVEKAEKKSKEEPAPHYTYKKTGKLITETSPYKSDPKFAPYIIIVKRGNLELVSKR